jgi:hypothetical protein
MSGQRRGLRHGWHIAVRQIVGEGLARSQVDRVHRARGLAAGLCFPDLGDKGQITKITDFWPEPHGLLASRTHLIERH